MRFPPTLSRIALFGATLGLIAFVWALLGPARENARRSTCQSNLKQIGLAFRQYIRDYDEKWPIVATASMPEGVGLPQHGFGWAGILQPYLKSVAVYQCPSERTPISTNPRVQGYIDYFYNEGLAKRNAAMPKDMVVVLAFEGPPANARAAAPFLPKSWVSNPNSSLYRHREGANYLFADGHVKWLMPDKIRAVKSSSIQWKFKNGVGEIWGPKGEIYSFDPR